MMRSSRIWIAGLVLALLASFVEPGAYDHYRITVDYDRRQQEAEAVKDAIKVFSGTLAGFYATGYTAGLRQFPAENPIRRRIFQDIENWEQSGMMLVMDRDRSVVKEIVFITPDLAIAVVDENWFSVYQNLQTRRQISAKKANIISVRYYLKKEWGRWIVFEYEVYEREDKIPPLTPERVLKWR